MKSPLRPEGFARRVVAEFRIEQAQRHVVGDGQRPRRLDQAPDLRFERYAHSLTGAVSAGAGFAVRNRTTPRRIIGSDRTMPMVSQPPKR